MRDLVAPDRHVLAAKDRDVAELQQWIAEKPVGRDLLPKRVDLSPIGRHSFEPRNRRDHPKQRLQLADLRNAGL